MMMATMRFAPMRMASLIAFAFAAGCDVSARSPVGASCETAAFCDDFESFASGTKPGEPWTASEISGAVVVDESRAFSGKQSVKFTTSGAASYKSVMIAHPNVNTLRGSSELVYGRMMFWLESAPMGDVHWTFVAGEGQVPGQTYRATLRYGGQHPITNGGVFTGSQLMANYETPDSHATPPIGPSTDCWQHSDQRVVPVGRWACAAWSFDAVNDEMRFWLDGVELPDLHVAKKGQGCVSQLADYLWDAPDVSKMLLGWESYQIDEPRMIWIDDVVIDTKPIVCP
jgi:hypothetical protein